MYLFISILESLYIIYMFNYYKTSVYLSHPLDVYTKNISFFNHSDKENHICLLGNIAGFLLPFWLIGRHYIKSKMKYNQFIYLILLMKYNQFIMNSFLFISFFSNLNAFLYFLQIYIIEFVSFR